MKFLDLAFCQIHEFYYHWINRTEWPHLYAALQLSFLTLLNLGMVWVIFCELLGFGNKDISSFVILGIMIFLIIFNHLRYSKRHIQLITEFRKAKSGMNFLKRNAALIYLVITVATMAFASALRT